MPDEVKGKDQRKKLEKRKKTDTQIPLSHWNALIDDYNWHGFGDDGGIPLDIRVVELPETYIEDEVDESDSYSDSSHSSSSLSREWFDKVGNELYWDEIAQEWMPGDPVSPIGNPWDGAGKEVRRGLAYRHGQSGKLVVVQPCNFTRAVLDKPLAKNARGTATIQSYADLEDSWCSTNERVRVMDGLGIIDDELPKCQPVYIHRVCSSPFWLITHAACDEECGCTFTLMSGGCLSLMSGGSLSLGCP